jgi:hypothetical protein
MATVTEIALASTQSDGSNRNGNGGCRRCGGFMVADRFYDWLSDSGRLEFEGARCISCGDILDPVILAHRNRSFKSAPVLNS